MGKYDPRRGPYMGILAYRHARRRRMWGEQTRYIAGLLKTARRIGLPAYAFGPQDVDGTRRRIRGWVPGPSRWQSRSFPWPGLVYDRFFLRRERGAGRHLARYRRFKARRRFRWLNPHLPDKWRVHRLLLTNPVLEAHLPPSILYRGAGDVTAALIRWRRVVLKPIRGQKGLGLWFLARRPGGKVRIRPSSGRSRVRRAAGMGSWCAGQLRRGRYMIQPYLSLRDPAGRARDVRVLVQRDGWGQVVVTGMGVRLGGRGSVVANLHRGGRAVPVDQALERVALPPALGTGIPPGEGTGEEKAPATGEAEEHLGRVAQEVFTTLDSRWGPLAEVGVDLGVDREGRIWFIEANGTPGRLIFRRIGDRDGRRRAVLNPMAYALSLLKAGAAPPDGP